MDLQIEAFSVIDKHRISRKARFQRDGLKLQESSVHREYRKISCKLLCTERPETQDKNPMIKIAKQAIGMFFYIKQRKKEFTKKRKKKEA